MSTPAPTPMIPQVFAPSRRLAARRRMLARQAGPEPAHWLFADMADDVLERLAFLRHRPASALVIGDAAGLLASALTAQGVHVTGAEPADPAGGFDEARPWPFPAKFELVVSLATLDTVNDLPGALIHLRRQLAAGGLALVAIPGAGSLPMLRAAMLAADGDRPAPRLHPQIDVRAAAALLQRCGFADPVVDSRTLSLAYRSFDRLIADLRDQGLTSLLANPSPPLTRTAQRRARDAFAAAADSAGRTVEDVNLLTLSGWAPRGGAPV